MNRNGELCEIIEKVGDERVGASKISSMKVDLPNAEICAMICGVEVAVNIANADKITVRCPI